MSNQWDNLTISRTRELLASGEVSAQELTEHYLQKIAQHNEELNVFITVDESARERAALVDQRLAVGQAEWLEGVPVAIKDVIVTKGLRTTAGSQILSNYNPPYNATVVERLLERGAIVLGKVNCDEFAMGSSNENSAYGAVKNPHDVTRVPGGSSGGSAAAVAADLCVYSLGTDTGGSIRQPASFCGVVGVKPTYGRVSRYGLIAMASSFDQAGPFTKNVMDAAIVLQAIAGNDKKDSSTSSQSVPDFVQSTSRPIKDMKVALPKQFLGGGLDEDVRQSLLDSVDKLVKLGVEIEEIDIPLLTRALAIYYIIMPAEVSANLARFDGIRYGRSEVADDLWSVYKNTRGVYLGEEVKRRILVGTYVLSAGYYDAYYKQALQAQRVMKMEMDKIWQRYDAVIGPTTPSTAWSLGSKQKDPLSMYLSDIYTVVANIVGSPAISLPIGKDQAGLPIGLQIMAKPWQEEKMLSLAWHLEQHRE
ncbi:MAG: Asp-tRNA(Asn)/Glu-tRNA(Gln) amidotransferase subunit GatA [Candidatus Komeilibacteria bacterium]